MSKKDNINLNSLRNAIDALPAPEKGKRISFKVDDRVEEIRRESGIMMDGQQQTAVFHVYHLESVKYAVNGDVWYEWELMLNHDDG